MFIQWLFVYYLDFLSAAGVAFFVLIISICPIEGSGSKTLKKRSSAKIKDNKLPKGKTFKSVSMTAAFVIGAASNGWFDWKTEDGKVIDTFRKHAE